MGVVDDFIFDLAGFSVSDSGLGFAWGILTAYLGLSYLKGKNLMASLVASLRDNRINPQKALLGEALKLVAAILLIIPGYLSDISGIILYLTKPSGVLKKLAISCLGSFFVIKRAGKVRPRRSKDSENYDNVIDINE